MKALINRLAGGRVKHLGGLVETIYGRRPGTDRDVYLLRLKLTPYTKRGQLLLHVFFRGDEDPDPHDHPFDFWTFPLKLSGYREEVMDDFGEIGRNRVRGWRWTFREAEHVHRVVGGSYKDHLGNRHGFPMATLVWRTQRRRQWGFWTQERFLDQYNVGELNDLDMRWMIPSRRSRYWIYWRTYLYGDRMTIDHCCDAEKKA